MKGSTILYFLPVGTSFFAICSTVIVSNASGAGTTMLIVPSEFLYIILLIIYSYLKTAIAITLSTGESSDSLACITIAVVLPSPSAWGKRDEVERDKADVE